MEAPKHRDPTPIPATTEAEYQEVAWGMPSFGKPFEAVHINRPKIAPKQVKFEMLYCGICHSDCFACEDNWGNAMWPLVPGHELLGRVTEIGEGVTKFKVGDTVGVGCFVEACLECEFCKDNEEQYCDGGMTGTYGGERKHGLALGDKKMKTWGGYSGSHVVHEHFVCKIPDNLPLDKAAPILCAGITMYDPLRHWGFVDSKPKVVGIVGIGGLGTMGIKLAKALGHTVVAISQSEKKKDMAKERGADHYVAMSVFKEAPDTYKETPKCHLIINSVSADHQAADYLPLLAKSGTLVQIGLVTQPHMISQLPLMFARKGVAGSLIGGIEATQEVLDLCGKHNIFPVCETILADKIDWVYEQLNNTNTNPEGKRYVLDIQASIKAGMVPK